MEWIIVLSILIIVVGAVEGVKIWKGSNPAVDKIGTLIEASEQIVSALNQKKEWKDLSNEAKKEKAVEMLNQFLEVEGITVSPMIIDVAIEGAVAGLKFLEKSISYQQELSFEPAIELKSEKY